MRGPRVSRPTGLSGRARAALYEALLGEAREVAPGSRAFVAAGCAERMTVVAATGGGARLLEGGGLDLRSLPAAAREGLLGGSPAELREDSLREALGRSERFGRSGKTFVFPVTGGGGLEGLLAVEALELTSEERCALAALCEELARLLGSPALAGDATRSGDQERLQALVEDLSELITVMEPDGSIRYVSSNVERVLGHRPEEYVGSNAFSYVHPEDAERVSESFFRRREEPSGTGEAPEFRVRHADGSWRLMRITARDRREDPAVRGVVVTSRDVTGERRRQRELRESEERLRAIFRQASEGMLLVDPETRGLMESNAALQDLLGYTAAELRGMTLYDIVAHDRESIDANLRRVAEGVHHIGERRYRRKDGSPVEVSASVSLVSYRGRTVVNVVARDIGERKRAEAALRESEERFRVLFEQAADALFVHDLEGRILAVNRRACESLGYTEEELLALSVYDIEQNLEPGGLRELWEWLGLDSTIELEGVHRRKDGDIFPVELHVVAVEVNGERLFRAAARDVTERRRMEDALRASEASLARAQQVARLGSWEAKMPGEGEPPAESPMRWSDEMYRIFGYEPGEVSPSFEIIVEATHPRDRPLVRRAIGKAVSRRDPFLNVEHRIVRPDGAVRNVFARIELIYDADGGFTGQFGTILDVTERKQVEERLRKSESRLSEAQRLAHVGSWEYDVARDRVLWSDEMYRIFGYEPQSFELTYRSFLKLVHPEDRGIIKRKIRRAVYDRSDDIEYRLVRPTGEERHVRGRYELRYERDEKAVHMVGVLQDVTKRKELEERLGYLAFHDPLTGLPNRAFFRERLEQALARRARGELALLFVDLDNFKDVNDSLGHEAGDEMLARVGERLQECLSPGDTVARFGGDEFVVLLEGAGDLAYVRAAAERITASLRAPFGARGREILLTTSIGIVQSGPGRGTPGELLRDADVALYRAKAEGRAGYEIFDEAMSARARERLDLAAELHRAVEKEQFVLHYQPKLELATGHIVGLEALLRWEHPERGMISPAEFVPLAEETGLIRPIGDWVLREACHRLVELRGSCGLPLTVSVNLSARQFGHPSLSEEVREALKESGLEPRCLVLEITESTVMRDAELAETTIQRLKNLGVQLSIDDFGTGYSNLAYLTRFPVDELKVDKCFVDGLGTGAKNAAIVRAVVDIAAALGLRVIAEGVESAGQVERLRELGCDRVQGYHFAKPLPPPELERFLSQLR